MEKIHIGRTIFTMDAAAKNRLAAYLADLKDYVLAHDVEIDVYEDIESRIEERLAALRSDGEITHADIVRLIGEMGAPEAIFGWESGKKESSSGGARRASFERVYRNSRRGKIFGVCYGLGLAAGVEPLWVRLALVIASIWFWYVTIPAYVIAAIVMKDDPDSGTYVVMPVATGGFARFEAGVRRVFEAIKRFFEKILDLLR